MITDVRVYNEVNVYGVNFTRDKLNPTEKRFLDGRIVAKYSSDFDFPVESIFVDKLFGTATQTRLTKGSCVRIEIKRGLKQNSYPGNDNVYRFVIKLKSFWNREFPLSSHPASYGISIITSYNGAYHKVLSVYANGEKFYAIDRTRKDIDYMFRFLQTIVNEMTYLEDYNFEGKDVVCKNPTEYYRCDQRREMLFWLSHFEELFKEVVDARVSAQKHEAKHHRAHEGSEPKKPPTYDRTKMGVMGIPESQIRLKSTKELADCVLTAKGFVVINCPKTHGRAFLVIRIEDYEHFITTDPKGKREFDRRLADDMHPLWRFYHHPSSYKRLKEFAF